MAGKSKSRQALEAKATGLGLVFDDETTSKDLGDAVKAAGEAQRSAEKPDAQGDNPPETVAQSDQHQEGAAQVALSDQPEPGAEGALIVIGPKKGRWRAGRHFTKEPVVVLVSELEAGQREMIEGDPVLQVEFLPPET
ncbi:hypothetical protein [Tropicibacter sp. S64]|uniref:hypothetical protein n=1 Tax=Tropicibacter sp. S64 TaxID=3415122 RepID=UPI003C7DE632